MRPWQKLLAAGCTALVLACAVGTQYEGERHVAYADFGGVWTLCRGHTQGVQPGDTATPDQCAAWMQQDMGAALAGVHRCIVKPMTVGQEAAFADLAYNVGIPTFCKSSIVRKFNAGDVPGACASIKLYNKAAGKVLPGLVKRRADEYALCMGDNDA